MDPQLIVSMAVKEKAPRNASLNGVDYFRLPNPSRSPRPNSPSRRSEHKSEGSKLRCKKPLSQPFLAEAPNPKPNTAALVAPRVGLQTRMLLRISRVFDMGAKNQFRAMAQKHCAASKNKQELYREAHPSTCDYLAAWRNTELSAFGVLLLQLWSCLTR